MRRVETDARQCVRDAHAWQNAEALIYEMKNGTARLLGVEYITPVAAWSASHPELPVLSNQHLQIA